MDLTDERDASQQTPAELDVRAVPDPAATQVVVGDIPEQRPGFLPRPDLLDQLDGSGHAPAVRVLTGTPGAGKTQLAAAYARAKLTAGWRLVAWVNAEDAASLLAGLTAVAVAVGVSERGSGSGLSLGDSGLAIRRWLESDGERCLLVLDNAGDPEVLRPFVPVGGAAQVLITAARESVADLGTSIPVDVFRATEALAFLAGRTALADETGASALAAELGHLPLALDLAASVIAGQFMGYRAYLGRLATIPAGEHLVVSKDQPYLPGTVEAVLLSLAASQEVDPGRVVAGVLDVMAALSAAGVRRELLHAAGEAGVLAATGPGWPRARWIRPWRNWPGKRCSPSPSMARASSCTAWWDGWSAPGWPTGAAWPRSTRKPPRPSRRTRERSAPGRGIALPPARAPSR